jgi:phage terminase large subunit GpA-like protein
MSYHFNDFLADPDALVADIFCTALKPNPPVDLATWAEANIIFGPNDRFPGNFRLDLFPFWRRPLEVLGPAHPCRKVTLLKSAQLGGTILADVFLLGYLDMAPSGLMCVHPTVDQGRKWVLNKVRDHVRHSPSLRRLLPLDNKSDAKATELHFERADRRGYVMVTGANSASSLSQHTIKRQVQDDLSKWDMNDAGDPEDQADTRSQAYDDAKILKIGTPTIVGSCRTTRSFLYGTQEYLHVACPHCATYQKLTPENFIESIEAGHADQPYFICINSECAGRIEERHRMSLLATARWVAENPNAKDISFSIWAAYGSLTSWAYLASRYLEAKGSAPKEQAIKNDVFGQAYEMVGDAPDFEKLKLRGDAFDVEKGKIPPGYYLLAAGIDVQLDRVEVGVWAGGPDLQSTPVDHIVISGHISTAETRAELKRILTTPLWNDAYGNSRPLDHACMDAGYDREHVLDFAKQVPASLLTIVVGARSESAPDVGRAQTKRVTRQGKRVRADRVVLEVGGAVIKSWLYKDLRKEDPRDRGYIQLLSGYALDWYEQLTSERREPVRNKQGFVQYKWNLAANRRNEVLDCAVYARAALKMLGWSRLSDAQWLKIAQARDGAPAPQQLDLLSIDQSQRVGAAPEPKKMSPDENSLSVRAENLSNEASHSSAGWLPESGEWL